MSSADFRSERAEGPWNPGINSELTRQLLALSSIFRPENIRNDLAQALEFHAVTGIPLESLAIFRPERLALHEVLVRVTADYEVPDPDDASVGSMGLNLRRMTQVLVSKVLDPHRHELNEVYHTSRAEIVRTISEELSAFDSQPAVEQHSEATRGFRRWLPKLNEPKKAVIPESEWDRDERILREWTARAHTSARPAQKAALSALTKVASAIRLRHGRILGRQTFLASLATDLACNQHGAEVIGGFLEPMIRDVAQKESFRPLPAQAHPVAMITKGASASGKSTMRPFQRKLARRMGIQWSDFALVSPDTWRRVFLDFDSLGPFYKYAGMLTSQEVTIVDRKLDAHLVRKGEMQQTSHLLLDRFRFDSFALDSDESKHLPSRYGGTLCYFLMITPPEITVERAWQRGLEVGRYKAVDDLLAHNIEAYTGMQNIMFGRALTPKGRVHYEFLDNDVPRGEVPLTVAFGWSGEMVILDIKRMLDIERYRKINIGAQAPNEVYPNMGAMAAKSNLDFLMRCVQKFPKLDLADRETGRIYAQFSKGRLEWTDVDALTSAETDQEILAVLHTISPDLERSSAQSCEDGPKFVRASEYNTIGRWASDKS
jgi:hypothetical protein